MCSKSQTDRFQLTKEDGTSFYVRFFNTEDNSKNLFQVTNQISLEGSYKNRYDVTLLVNGCLGTNRTQTFGHRNQRSLQPNQSLPEPFFWSHGLFQYVQLFVISNGSILNIWPTINCNRSKNLLLGRCQ
jgi:type I restriction enzyme R subunit